MRTTPIDFLAEAEVVSPASKIFNMIRLAVELTSQSGFVNACLRQVVAAAGDSLTEDQRTRMELAAATLVRMGFPDPEAVAMLLTFILYGDWQDVGLDKDASSNAFASYQRGETLQIAYAEAVSIVAMSGQLNVFGNIDLGYPELDWQLETPV